MFCVIIFQGTTTDFHPTPRAPSSSGASAGMARAWCKGYPKNYTSLSFQVGNTMVGVYVADVYVAHANGFESENGVALNLMVKHHVHIRCLDYTHLHDMLMWCRNFDLSNNLK